MTLTEDIVEDAFVKLWEERNKIQHEPAIHSWLYTTARNKAFCSKRILILTQTAENIFNTLVLASTSKSI